MQLSSEDIIRAIDKKMDARRSDLLRVKSGDGSSVLIACMEDKLAGLEEAREIVVGMAENQIEEMAEFYAEDAHVEEG